MRDRKTVSPVSMALSSLVLRKNSSKCSCFLLTVVSARSLSSSLCRGKPFKAPLQVPPLSKKVPFTVSVHDKTWEDPYHWMSHTQDTDFLNYLKQENEYAEAFMADTRKVQATLFSEMTSRIPVKISTPPERWGPWLYYQYIPEGKEYPVLCRRLDTERTGWMNTLIDCTIGRSKREQILLDWNAIAETYGYVHVGTCRVSPDHNFLAYTLDTSGCERFVLHIKDLKSGFVDSKMQVDGVVSLAWAQDGNTLFYTLSDDNQRPYRVVCIEIGSGNTYDHPVFTESSSRFCVDITSTKDGKFITVNSNSRTSSEVYVIDAAKPLDGLRKIHKRVSGVQFFLEHHYGSFYILTNSPLLENKKWSGEDYYLVRGQVEDIESANWQNIIFPGEDTSLQDIDIFNGHLVLYLNKKCLPLLCSLNLPLHNNYQRDIDLHDLKPWYFPLPSTACSVVPGSNHDFMNSVYRAVLSSPVMPDVIVDYDMSRQTYTIVHQEEVKGVSVDHSFPDHELQNDTVNETLGSNEDSAPVTESQRWKNFSDLYCCQRKEVISPDGVIIPLTILYSRESWKKGQSPGLIQAYGAYGEVLDKMWCSDRLSLLNRGWVIAFADVRGGGGASSWHKCGSGLNKLNSINDFVSCGNYLVNEGYVHRDRLSSIGWSAGCLLIGAAINMCPNLFQAVILKVPFLDICNTLLDPSLPLTTMDYEEFGNPGLQSQFDYIFSYSPYDNISEGACYPSVLVTASFHDTRVGVWDGAKWVAKVRDRTCAECCRAAILKTNMRGGHFGEGGRHGHCEETAFDYAFLMKTVGVFT